MLIWICARSWLSAGVETKTFFSLLMCCLFFLVGVWCQTVGSPCGLPHQPAASCASMNIKKERRTSELRIPERKKEELNGESKWLHCLQKLGLFTFSPEKFHLGLCQRAERADRTATVLRGFFFCLNLIFSLGAWILRQPAAQITSTGHQYVSCHCNVSFDAMDSPEYRGGFCRAHRFHECGMADWQSKAFKLWRCGQQNGGFAGALPSDPGHLRALHQNLPHAVF